MVRLSNNGRIVHTWLPQTSQRLASRHINVISNVLCPYIWKLLTQDMISVLQFFNLKSNYYAFWGVGVEWVGRGVQNVDKSDYLSVVSGWFVESLEVHKSTPTHLYIFSNFYHFFSIQLGLTTSNASHHRFGVYDPAYGCTVNGNILQLSTNLSKTP